MPSEDVSYISPIEREDSPMTTTDKAKNTAQQAKGKLKEAAGKVTGNDHLRAEGRDDQTEASLKQAAENMKDALRS
jgi:uncharacterized protein YjbJ (UPF0337 family)